MQVEMEQGFPRLVERQLNQSGGRRVEIINLSVDAFGTDRELLLYALLGWQFQPDAVVLAVYTGNDIQDNQIDLEQRRYGYRLDRPYFTLADGTLRLHNSAVFDASRFPASPVFQWLARYPVSPPVAERPSERPRMLNTNPYTLEYPVEMGIYLPADTHWANAWALTEALLRQFRAVVQTQHIPFGVVIIPDRRAVHTEDWLATVEQYSALQPTLRVADPDQPAARLDHFLQQNNIPVLNLSGALRAWAQSQPQGRLYYRGDGHFNADGHAVAAGRISGWIQALGWGR
jgi:hypothetical protein